jgi:hypothetical protein
MDKVYLFVGGHSVSEYLCFVEGDGCANTTVDNTSTPVAGIIICNAGSIVNWYCPPTENQLNNLLDHTIRS